ncbi:hypothetical protein ACSSS7_001179 [Eimeria intestinalis]
MRNCGLLLLAAAAAALLEDSSTEEQQVLPGIAAAAAAELPDGEDSEADSNQPEMGLSFEDFLSSALMDGESEEDEGAGSTNKTGSKKSSSNSNSSGSKVGQLEDGLQQLQAFAKGFLGSLFAREEGGQDPPSADAEAEAGGGNEAPLGQLMATAKDRLTAALAAATDTTGAAGGSLSAAGELTRLQLQELGDSLRDRVNQLLQAAAQTATVQDLQRVLELLRGAEPRTPSELILKGSLEHLAMALVLAATAAAAATNSIKGEQLLPMAASALSQLQTSSNGSSNSSSNSNSSKRKRRGRRAMRRRRRKSKTPKTSQDDLLQKLLEEIRKDEEDEEDEEERDALQQVQKHLKENPHQLRKALDELMGLFSPQNHHDDDDDDDDAELD